MKHPIFCSFQSHEFEYVIYVHVLGIIERDDGLISRSAQIDNVI
jgi:hypothetical protein